MFRAGGCSDKEEAEEITHRTSPATRGEKGKFTARGNRVAEVCHTDEPEKAARPSARG
jgi:hypothetical protein